MSEFYGKIYHEDKDKIFGVRKLPNYEMFIIGCYDKMNNLCGYIPYKTNQHISENPDELQKLLDEYAKERNLQEA